MATLKKKYTDDNRCCGIEWTYSFVLQIAIGVAAVSGFVLVIAFIETVQELLLQALATLDSLGMTIGALILSSSMIVCALLVLPCLPFTLAAGFLYGSPIGTLIVFVASNAAAVFAFLISRHLLRKYVEQWICNKGGKWKAIDHATRQDGFKIVFLVRSSPLHPFSVVNYVFGITSIGLFDYTIASLIAMFPATLAEVYFGTAMKDLGDIVNGDMKGSAIGRTFFWIGISITFIVTIFVTLWVRQKLNNELVKYHYVNIPSTSDNASTDDQHALKWVASPVLSTNVKHMELEGCVQGHNGCDEQSFSNPSVCMPLSAEKSFVDPEVVSSMTEMHPSSLRYHTEERIS